MRACLGLRLWKAGRLTRWILSSTPAMRGVNKVVRLNKGSRG